MFRIVNKAHQYPAIGVTSIATDVYKQLFPKFLGIETLPCHLDLDTHPFIFQKDVNAGTGAGKARCGFFATNVVKVNDEERVKQVLNIVFVLDLKRKAARVAFAQLAGSFVESLTEPSHNLDGIVSRARFILLAWRTRYQSLRRSFGVLTKQPLGVVLEEALQYGFHFSDRMVDHVPVISVRDLVQLPAIGRAGFWEDRMHEVLRRRYPTLTIALALRISALTETIVLVS